MSSQDAELTLEIIKRELEDDYSEFSKGPARSVIRYGAPALVPLVLLIEECNKSVDVKTSRIGLAASEAWNAIARLNPETVGQALAEDDPDIRACTAGQIGEWQLFQYSERLSVLAIEDSDPLVVAQATLAIGRLYGPFATRHADPYGSGRQEELVDLFASIGFRTINRRLCELIAAPPRKANTPPSQSPGHLPQDRSSRHERTRSVAILAAGEVGTYTAIPLLVEIVDNFAWHVAEAVISLGKLRAVAAIEPFTKHIYKPMTPLRAMIAEALGSIGSVDGMESLFILAKDAKPLVRQYACASIGMVGGPSAKDVLIQLSKDPDEGVRRAARKALSNCREHSLDTRQEGHDHPGDIQSIGEY